MASLNLVSAMYPQLLPTEIRNTNPKTKQPSNYKLNKIFIKYSNSYVAHFDQEVYF